MKQKRHIYLISDSTGETVRNIARACAVQFENIEVVEHLWPMVRSARALDIVVDDIATGEPGLVFYTLVNKDLAARLKSFCSSRGIAHISALDPFITLMAQHFGSAGPAKPGRQHEMDAEYFQRIDAIHYVMAHDDGQQQASLAEAAVVLVGVSRTSKTPTCIYLANRGIKAANVPLVPGIPLPEILFRNPNIFVVGLTEDPARLVEIRKTRLRVQEGEHAVSDYTNFERVKEEVSNARRLFTRHNWPVIDVTRRSIEETAAAIMHLSVAAPARRRRKGRQGVSPSGERLILASASATRAALLRQAGIAATQIAAAVDEDEIKRKMKNAGADAGSVALALAEAKAMQVSRLHPQDYVLGADQMLVADDAWFDKAADRGAARAQLAALRGRSHRLLSAACVVRGGARLWQALEAATLVMRPFSDGFLEHYLDSAGNAALRSVGAYQLEGLGAQLFERVEGDYFVILGLPLLPLLEFLRRQGIVPA